ncbi:MAG: M42 family metallopeptidase [Candidatus Omnitrophota bacterium]|nr:M42 family metallopeptidase [Candidatus Omnitrophota bacterium]
MENLLREVLTAGGISGDESEVAAILKKEFERCCDAVTIDNFGNIIARKGKGERKIMLAAHMDEVGLVVKHITKDGYLRFIKIGGIDDRILLAQRVMVKTKKGLIPGIIGSRPPHVQKEEEKKQVTKCEDMFIDVGCKDKKDAESLVSVGDPVLFEASFGRMNNNLYFAKAVDDRVGCYCLVKIMERINANAEVFAVATAQEEVGLKGARTSSFKINPDFAIAIDTTSAGDTPSIKEAESTLRLGEGAAITIMEAGGRGVIVNKHLKDLFIEVAKANNIKYQLDILEGGMTDAAIISMNREGIPAGVLSIPARYVHSPTGVFSLDDVNAVIELAVKSIEKLCNGLN